jgi:hypothetical protein
MTQDFIAHSSGISGIPQTRPYPSQVDLAARMRAVGRRLVAYRARHAQAHLTLYGLDIAAFSQRSLYEMEELL